MNRIKRLLKDCGRSHMNINICSVVGQVGKKIKINTIHMWLGAGMDRKCVQK